MDQRFLSYYNRELAYLRELGGEFAKAFPKIAGRLGLDAFECADPYVERLLEGFAFMAARIQLKIDSDFPRFTEHLLSIAYPHYLAPTPSMAVVKLEPSYKQGALTEGFNVPRDTALRSNTGRGDQIPCEYRTAHPVTLWPIELVAVSHSAYVGDLGDLNVANPAPVRSALRFRFRTLSGVPFSALSLDRLPLFVRGADSLAFRTYELCCAGALGLVIRSAERPAGDKGAPEKYTTELVRENGVRQMGFEDSEALLPFGPRSFQGYRLLHEYFALPTRFMFFELANLGPALSRCRSSEVEIVVLLDRYSPQVEAAITPSQFELFCTPAINLFPKKIDRIHLNDKEHEYHVIADRTRPLDYEVHSVNEVVGFGNSATMQREFKPFYSCTERTMHDTHTAYYTLHRQPRLLSSKSRATGPRSSYTGSELFISLVDGNAGPYNSDLKQLALEALCTNRDLALHMSVGEGRTDFVMDSGAPVESVRCVAGPSEPRPSHAWGTTSWRLISHLSLNHLSITDTDPEQGATMLREMLHLYGDLGGAASHREIEGMRSISTNSTVRRLPIPGPASFSRGLEITLTCDENAFEGGSAFILGSVLERFFAKHAALNSFTETVLRSQQRGEIMRWPARLGRGPLA
ncbi:MAG TPA: type VI secretion system baseplate subunit TssF [Polyangiaceae bacterium]|nr:type VI secretion system baseplate subunit TssF [Polyangiaceae bacterium]